jgi:hypothetical protein
MTDATISLPSRNRRKAHSRRPPLRRSQRRYHRVDWRRFPTSAAPSVSPELALFHIMRDGDVFRIGRRHYLVAPIDAEQLEALIAAAGSCEDMEPETDRGIDDEPHDEGEQDMEPSLAGIHAGAQPGISDGDREGDPCDLGEPEEFG